MTDAAIRSEPRAAPPRLPTMAPGAGFDMLAGIRVLDLTTSVAGPYAGMLLGDMGAEVIKIERPGTGDDARAWGPPFLDGESLWFLSMNRNKKSVALDYSKSEGLAALKGLARHCDVILCNQPPRVSAKLGVDEPSLRVEREDLIYVSITGFGLTGARADQPCYDLIAEGYSGIMDLTGEADGEAQKVGAPAADMLAGQDAAFAAVAALFDRGRTGKGRLIDIALVDTMTRFLAARIVPYLGSGEAPRRSGGRDSVIAIYQAFDTADEPITLGLGNDNIWHRFWQAVGQPDFSRRPAYASNAKRRERRAEIVERIQAVLATRGRDEWLGIFRTARVPAGPINRVDQVAADPELQRRGLFYSLAGAHGAVPQVGTGFMVDGKANVPRAAPPRLGQHNSEVLGSLLGYDDDKIRALAGSDID